MSELRVRVYYADTDAAGVLYHAAAIGYFDRGRTEWLRARGLPLRELQRRHGCVFAVHELQARYARPARLDDELLMRTELDQARGASLLFAQELRLDGSLLVRARIRVACVDADTGRARPLPAPLRALGAAHA